MQTREELIAMLDRAGYCSDEIEETIGVLLQLKGCKVHSLVKQTDDEGRWLKARKSGIGGSDIAAIMGESTWKSAYDIWLDKTDQVPASEVKAQSEPARWGNLLEDTVAYEWAKRESKKIVKLSVTLASLVNPYFLANIDGFVLDDNGRVEAILEIKTTSAYNAEPWEVGPLPYYYICQANWYAMITGIEHIYLVCLVGGQRLFSHHMPRLESLCERMTIEGQKFWEVNVLQMVAPEWQAADRERIQQMELSTEVADQPLENMDDEINKLVGLYITARTKESELKKVKEALGTKIRAAMLGYREMLTQEHIASVSSASRRNCDFELLKSLHPQAYDDCVSMTVSNRLNIK